MNTEVVKNGLYVVMMLIQIVMSTTAYTPQIVKLIRRKSSDDISLGFWYICLTDFISYQILLWATDAQLTLHVINLLQIIQIIVVIGLIKYYRHPKHKNMYTTMLMYCGVEEW